MQWTGDTVAPAIIYEYIWLNGHPVGQVDGGVVNHWTFTDHLGTPIIQTDASGNIYWQAEYEPYGRVFALRTADQHQPLRLPGQEAEQMNLGQNGKTDRKYNIFRWYRARQGRYTQADPLGIVDTDLYSYASGNPVLNIDVDGQQTTAGMSQQKCLTCTVYAEARGKSAPCQAAVMAIILNRVDREGLPVCDVVQHSRLGPFYGASWANPNFRWCMDCFTPKAESDYLGTVSVTSGSWSRPTTGLYFCNSDALGRACRRQRESEHRRPIIVGGCRDFVFYN